MKEGWKYIDFKDVYPIKMGKTPPRGDKASWDVEKLTHNKWVSIADISQNEGHIIYDTKEYVSDSAAEKINQVAKGSLLMSFKLSIGRMAFAGDDLYTNEAIIAIPEHEEYNLRFIYYYLMQYDWKSLTEGNEKVKGATLNKQSIGKIKLPVIPLSTQHSIVTYLDSAFSKIDAIAKQAEESLDNAKALFQATLKKMLEKKEGWEEKKIGDLFQTYAGGTPLKQYKEYYDGGNIPWLRSGEVCQKYITQTELYITQKGMENSSAKYYPINTVAVAMYGATAAQVGILKLETTSNQAVCGILPNSNFLPEFVYYWFTYIKDDLAAQAQGGAQPNISQVKIKNVLIPTISLEEQKQIVTTLEDIDQNLTHLQTNYNQTLLNCQALKQSLLRQVFE